MAKTTMRLSDGQYADGDRIGPYRILELLGQGGMGEVYLAEQQAPMQRRVALKVIKLGMDTKQVLARFEAERQALALMDHPNIAKVLEASVTESGRPYFVMEYVRGQSLIEYCDLHRVSTKDRLRIFIALCNAVQHAHQKGVIHRDLKPSNVLVTVSDGSPVPKVIDFGIAKAIGQRLTDLTLHTVLDQPIGTPEYMSPEQAEMRGLDVDTRTDVYSLGVILYELLVGALPFDLEAATPAAVQVLLRESEPPRPSTRLSSLGDGQSRVAELRRTDPRALRSALRGDLDWIVMKAMDKDRTRRYDTVNALALEIERHLNDEPVLAGSPSTAYRMRKFVRRHALGVTAAAAITTGLVGGAVLAAVGMVRAQRAERAAAAEAAAAREVADFLVSMFEGSDPGEGGRSDVTAREILETGVERIRGELGGQPLAQARLMTTMGEVYTSLAAYDQAEELLGEALALGEREGGRDHVAVAATLASLGDLARMQGRYPEAEQHLRRAVQIYEDELGASHAWVGDALNTLGIVLTLQARHDEAEAVLLRALALAEDFPEDQDPSALGARLDNLANVYTDQGRLAEADSFYERAIAAKARDLGPEHPLTAMAISNLGISFWYQGRLDEAQAQFRRTLEIQRGHFGDDHPTVGDSHYLLGLVGLSKPAYQEAESHLERALAIYESALGPDHPDVGLTLNGLSHVYGFTDRYEEAEPLQRRAVAVAEATLGPNHPTTVERYGWMGQVLRALGRLDEAETFLSRVVTHHEETEPESRAHAVAISHLRNLYLQQGRLSEAEQTALRSIEIMEGFVDPDPNEMSMARQSLAEVYAAQSRYTEAESIYVRVLEDVRGRADPAAAAEALARYANVLRDSGRALEADSVEAEADAVRAALEGGRERD